MPEIMLAMSWYAACVGVPAQRARPMISGVVNERVPAVRFRRRED
jgi:hypothetical protein